ncbi:MAG: hypothetical protein ACE5FM_07770, partial [Methyloligellaceae bacterium]
RDLRKNPGPMEVPLDLEPFDQIPSQFFSRLARQSGFELVKRALVGWACLLGRETDRDSFFISRADEST